MKQPITAQSLERALAPKRFIDYEAHQSFMRGLKAMRMKILGLFEGGNAESAVDWFEKFIDGCYDRTQTVDDHSGTFGDFVGQLFCDWTVARQKAGKDPGETATVLLAWMDNDKYGFCNQLERRVVSVLDEAGVAAFLAAIQAFEPQRMRGSFTSREKGEALRAIHFARGDAEAYQAQCDAEGAWTPEDFGAMARMLLKRGQAESAFSWVGRGMERMDAAGEDALADLPPLRREVLMALGRSQEALESAWDAFRNAPSESAFAELFRYVPKDEVEVWRARALEALGSATLWAQVPLLLKLNEIDRLAEVIAGASRTNLAQLGAHAAKSVPKALRLKHPLLAAKLHVALALGILEANKSRSYGMALQHLATARALLFQEHREGEWENLALEIRVSHWRKTGFMPGFERVDQGGPAKEPQPSFLEKARKRWER